MQLRCQHSEPSYPKVEREADCVEPQELQPPDDGAEILCESRLAKPQPLYHALIRAVEAKPVLTVHHKAFNCNGAFLGYHNCMNVREGIPIDALQTGLLPSLINDAAVGRGQSNDCATGVRFL